MANYARVRTDNMLGIHRSAELVSLMFMKDGVSAPIENGNFVLVGGYIEGEQDYREASVPAADSALANIALVAGVEVDKREDYNSLAEYINRAGVAFRGYRLHKHDCFSVTAEALSAEAEIAVGNIVELQADTKAKVVASLTEGSTQIGTVMAIEGEWIVIEV